MIPMPTNPAGHSTQTATPLGPQLGGGTHKVRLAEFSYIRSSNKYVALYLDANGAFFKDWLKSDTEGRFKRTFAYICRLHELAGLPVPKDGIDAPALLAAHANLDLWITIIETPNDTGSSYTDMNDFPSAVGNAHAAAGSNLPF